MELVQPHVEVKKKKKKIFIRLNSYFIKEFIFILKFFLSIILLKYYY